MELANRFAARSLLTLLAIAPALAAIACGGESQDPNPAAACGAGPPAGGPVLAIFSRPFAGDFQLVNYFDHDLPIQQSGNEFQLTTCGERVTGRIDGHGGYDWLLPSGTPLLATSDGTVVFAGVEAPGYCAVLGRTVSDQLVVSMRSEGSDRYDSQYLHLSRVDVAAGDQVTRGQVLGLSGNTGCSTEPHLHFQVRTVDGPNPGALIDPYGWAGDGPDPWALDPNGAASVWLWQEGEAPGLDVGAVGAVRKGGTGQEG